MKIEVCIPLTSTPPQFRDKLRELFPKYAGPRYQFTFQGSSESQDYKDILKFLFKEGFSIGPPWLKLDYSKQFVLYDVFRFEEQDLELCEYFSFDSTRMVNSGQGEAIILDDIALINKPTPKFKYVISSGSVWFVAKNVKEALESEGFKGLLLYPVELVKGNPSSRAEWIKIYSDKSKVAAVPNVYALSSSVQIDYDCYMSGVRHFFRSTLRNAGPFDLAIPKERGGPMYCSQHFYRFWKEHFDDLEFSPMIVA